MPIHISPDYWRNARTHKIPPVTYPPGVARAGRHPSQPGIVIAAMNTNIDFSSLPKRSVSRKKLARATPVPTCYRLDWFYPILMPGNPTDPSTNQFMQYTCGCCWAYSIASCIGDIYTIARNYASPPYLSWTYLLANYPNESTPSSISSISAIAPSSNSPPRTSAAGARRRMCCHGSPRTGFVRRYAWTFHGVSMTRSAPRGKIVPMRHPMRIASII